MLKVMSKNVSILDNTFHKEHLFSSGHAVPVFNVSSVQGLNQIIGYGKYINRDYGMVFYRGQCKLHTTMQPSIFHNIKSQKARSDANCILVKMIDSVCVDKQLMSEFGLQCASDRSNLIVEGALQHYGINTHCIDAVDNHWIALWFGLNKYVKINSNTNYVKYLKRSIATLDVISAFNSKLLDEEFGHQYLLLIASGSLSSDETGIGDGSETISVDLRRALPSVFLRPHAQHGFVLKKKARPGNEDYDLSKSVIAILRMRIDFVESWLGVGQLLTQQNLFPSPGYDHGYNILLKRSDIFLREVSIPEYVY